MFSIFCCSILGSENNSLYIYYKGLSQQLLTYKFDPVKTVLVRHIQCFYPRILIKYLYFVKIWLYVCETGDWRHEVVHDIAMHVALCM